MRAHGIDFEAANSQFARLSERQREVLALVADGLTNGEVADRLGMTLDGAKWHVSEILGKLGFDSREDAADFWRWRNAKGKGIRSLARAVLTLSVLRAAAALTAATVFVLFLLSLFLTSDPPRLDASFYLEAEISTSSRELLVPSYPRAYDRQRYLVRVWYGHSSEWRVDIEKVNAVDAGLVWSEGVFGDTHWVFQRPGRDHVTSELGGSAEGGLLHTGVGLVVAADREEIVGAFGEWGPATVDLLDEIDAPASPDLSLNSLAVSADLQDPSAFSVPVLVLLPADGKARAGEYEYSPPTKGSTQTGAAVTSAGRVLYDTRGLVVLTSARADGTFEYSSRVTRFEERVPFPASTFTPVEGSTVIAEIHDSERIASSLHTPRVWTAPRSPDSPGPIDLGNIPTGWIVVAETESLAPYSLLFAPPPGSPGFGRLDLIGDAQPSIDSSWESSSEFQVRFRREGQVWTGIWESPSGAVSLTTERRSNESIRELLSWALVASGAE